MHMKKIWEFKEKDNVNIVRAQRDGKLSCGCVDFALFGYCDHIRYVELNYMKEDVIIIQCGAV